MGEHEFKDWPGWIVQALVAELQGDAREWQLAERLRERFLGFDVELRALGDESKPLGIEARAQDGSQVAGEFLRPEPRPVYEALHRLCQRVGEVRAG